MKKLDLFLQQRMHSQLSDLMSLNSFSQAKMLLAENRNNIDVFYGEGRYFYFSVRYNNSEMLEDLLKLFEESKIEQDNLSMSSVYARYRLRNFLQDAIYQFGSTEKINKLTSKYLPSAEVEDDNEQDLTGFEEALDELGEYDGDESMHPDNASYTSPLEKKNSLASSSGSKNAAELQGSQKGSNDASSSAKTVIIHPGRQFCHFKMALPNLDDEQQDEFIYPKNCG